jgi:hypothetical protein
MTPFSLRIFVADGDPDGLRIVDRTNWNGKALVFPRAAWAQPSVATRPELQQTGVYLLLGPREDGEGDRLYIGEGDPIKPRLASHHSGTAQKDFWTRAICFVSMGQALNKAHVQFLEANLIRLAKQAKRVPLDVENKKNESEPTLSEADRADMQVFLAHMLAKRQELIDLGVLAQQGTDNAFTQDYTFSSPSTAASVVLGRSANGRLEWKDAQGRALKLLQNIN